MLDSLLTRLGSRVSRELAVFIACFSLALGVILVVVAHTTSVERQTKFGTQLMPDYAAMYLAGRVLNEYGPERLYDFELQEKVRRSDFPHSPASERLPYVYAPWWALVWMPFAKVSYETSGALWLATSLGLMLAGLACLARAFPELSRRDFVLVSLLVLSFEPFLFECWANGQVSSFPFLCVSAALMFERAGNPFAAGMVLALLTYKPMQPPLLFALLLLGGRWRLLGGIAAGGAVLAAVSMAVFGPGILLEYPQRLLDYGNLIGGNAQLRYWKYTDLQTAAQLVGPPLETPLRIAFVPVTLFFVASLAMMWRRAEDGWTRSSQRAWAATLILLPVLNFYFAVYDALIMIPGVLAAATLVARRDGERFELPLSFLGALTLVYFAGLFIPAFETIRINLMTVSLLVLGWYVLRRIPDEARTV